MVAGVNGGELLLLIVVALVVLGPERLPHYVETLKRWVREGRAMLRAAQQQLRDEAGDPLAGVDWSAYDPRQYDPRRIIREALSEDEVTPVVAAARKPQAYDPARPTPFDDEAT